MSFFNFNPTTPPGSNTWHISDKFWIYWAFTIPTTLLTAALWVVWQKWHAPSVAKTITKRNNRRIVSGLSLGMDEIPI